MFTFYTLIFNDLILEKNIYDEAIKTDFRQSEITFDVYLSSVTEKSFYDSWFTGLDCKMKSRIVFLQFVILKLSFSLLVVVDFRAFKAWGLITVVAD